MLGTSCFSCSRSADARRRRLVILVGLVFADLELLVDDMLLLGLHDGLQLKQRRPHARDARPIAPVIDPAARLGRAQQAIEHDGADDDERPA
jgi:hypothetical protein